MKQSDQKTIVAQLPKWRATGPITIEYVFYCKNKRIDKDNISGYFHKIFQDALIDKRIIDNDGWENICGFSDSFYIDKANPRVEILISEVGNDT